MAAAAPNLTPLTLELGGKSPAIVAADFPIEQAAARLATGKWLNSGQTCIAPDYVLVDHARRDALVTALREQARARYGDLKQADDFTRIINEGQYRRLRGYLDDAPERGLEVIELVALAPDRKSGVEGKGVSVRVDHGGRGYLKTNNTKALNIVVF